jgi:hypothetical protein
VSGTFYLSFATSEDTHFSHNLRAIQSMEIHNEQFSSLYEFVPAHATKAYRGSRGIAPVILNFGTRRERSSSLLAHLILRNKPRYPINKRMGGYQSCYGRFEKVINSVSSAGIQTPGRPALTLVAILATQFRLLLIQTMEHHAYFR